MAERKSQVDSRMDMVHQQQRESLERREELLNDMERTNLLVKQEKEKQQKEKILRKQEVHLQVNNTFTVLRRVIEL